MVYVSQESSASTAEPLTYAVEKGIGIIGSATKFEIYSGKDYMTIKVSN